jgi:DNA primase
MAERRLLARMMRSREITERVRKSVGGLFHSEIDQALAAGLYAYYDDGNPPDEGLFIQQIEDPLLQKRAVELSMISMSPQAEEQEISDCIHQVIRHSKSSMISELEEKRKQAEQSGRYSEAAQILSQIIDMKKQLDTNFAE